MCLHLYSTVCPVVCDHLRIDVTYLIMKLNMKLNARNGLALSVSLLPGGTGAGGGRGGAAPGRRAPTLGACAP